MDYMQNNFIEIAKAGNLKFIEKIPTGELTAQNIFVSQLKQLIQFFFNLI